MRNTLAAKHSSIDSVDDSIIMKRAKIGNPLFFLSLHVAPFIPMTPDYRQYLKFSENRCTARLMITFTQPYSINSIRWGSPIGLITVEPLNKGHHGANDFVPISEVK